MSDPQRSDKLVEHFIVACKRNGKSSAWRTRAAAVEMKSCYPEGSRDDRDFCRSVAMFMFPHGFGADAWGRRSLLPPPPTHHIFALTDVRGDRLFGASLCFFEAGASPSSGPSASRGSSRKPTDDSSNSDNEDASCETHDSGHSGSIRKSATTQLIEPQAKAICLLSRLPIYVGLLRYLEQLLLLGLRQSHVTSCVNRLVAGVDSFNAGWPAVEKTLCNLFHEVPAPLRGLGVQVTVADSELVLERELPFDMDAELMALAFTALEPPLLARLVIHALLEHRILVVVGSGSSHPTASDGIVTTALVETLRSLLFPFPWLHVSVPSVPDVVDLPTLLEAPVPFIAGAHAHQLAGLCVPCNVVKLEFVGGRFVLDEGQAANDESTDNAGEDPGEVQLPPLPACAHDLFARLSAARLPDLRARKKELHQRLWDRRIHLQKSCLLATSAPTAIAAISGSKSVFLVRANMLHKKMMKLFQELTASLLEGLPACVSAGGANNISSNQSAFDQERFVQLKPIGERVFYRQLVRTAHFQSFVTQYQDYLAGALPVDDAVKIQSVLHKLLRAESSTKSSSTSALSSLSSSLSSLPILNSSSKDTATVTSPTAGAFLTGKTFVAQTPNVPPLSGLIESRRQSVEQKCAALDDTADRRRSSTTTVTAWGRFPDIDLASFGRPRDVEFPQQPVDTAMFSLGTLVPKSVGIKRPTSNKDAGIEWMQQLLQSVSSSIKRLDASTPSDRRQNQPQAGRRRGAPAPFTRSRTIDRIGAVSTRSVACSRSPTTAGFHRTFTQRDAQDGNAPVTPSNARLNRFHSLRSPESLGERRRKAELRGRDRAETVTTVDTSDGVWLATTSECSCTARIAELTAILIGAQQRVKQRISEESSARSVTKALERVAVASSVLIDALGDCGHPGEAKAVFEDCLASFNPARSGDATPVVSLETIADSGEGGAWRAFSALVRCYVRNGLVQRAFDLLVQVKVRDEKMLDPSLGVLGFSASVVSAERQVVLQRVYATFSAGNLGLALSSRNAVADSGCVVLSTGNHVVDNYSLGFDQTADGEQSPSSVVEPNDVVETINGEMVLHYPFPTIVARLKRAYRPMTVTLLRGMAKATSLHAWCQELAGDSASVTDPSVIAVPAAAIDSQSLEAGTRSALCDRFGLLPRSSIRITAVADCAACSSRASLADIQAGWSMTDENDYTTRCARCGRRFVPRLSVEAERPDVDEPVGVHVEYLSTLVVRKELANLAQKLPLSSLTMAQLRARNPRIYWNVVVKLLALACPLNFMELPGASMADDGEASSVESHEDDDHERESVASDVSASCGTEPSPLTDDENHVRSDDDDGWEVGQAEDADNDSAINNNSSEEERVEECASDCCQHDMDALERVFLATVAAHARVGGGGESLADVSAKVLARLQQRAADESRRNLLSDKKSPTSDGIALVREA